MLTSLVFGLVLCSVSVKSCKLLMKIIGGASAASEATLSSCPLRFAVYVGIIIIVCAINP